MDELSKYKQGYDEMQEGKKRSRLLDCGHFSLIGGKKCPQSRIGGGRDKNDRTLENVRKAESRGEKQKCPHCRMTTSFNT
jgi:hypothetical protein